jgi:hypothetical protein
MANFLSRAWIEQQTLDQLKVSLSMLNQFSLENVDVGRETAFDWLDENTLPIEKPSRAQIIKVKIR